MTFFSAGVMLVAVGLVLCLLSDVAQENWIAVTGTVVTVAGLLAWLVSVVLLLATVMP